MRLSTLEYKKRKELVKKFLGLNDQQLAELVKGDYETGCDMIVQKQVEQTLHSSERFIALDADFVSNWDFIWFYKRNMHFIVPEPMGYSVNEKGFDTSCLNSLDKDIDIDTEINGKPVFIRLVHRNIPVKFDNTTCYWTIDCYAGEHNLHYSFVGGEFIKKVYIDSVQLCKECRSCGQLNDYNGIPHYRRPRFRQDCVVSQKVIDPMFALAICLEVASTYVNREKLVRSRNNENRRKVRSIMVARETDGNNTERAMSMYEYVKEYRESQRQEWKGGHHASPVSHPRSGYYRKSRVGTHIIKDGEFVFVGKGLGKYTYVEPTIVNAEKDSVVAEVL